MNKIKIIEIVLVEGKYDKIKLHGLLDADIFTTNGFSLFNHKEKCALFARLAETRGILLVTDSDGAGFLIRNKLKGILPKERVKHLYIPQVEGKERRKNKTSKQGLLGVEGMENALLRNLFLPFAADHNKESCPAITKAQFYAAGYSGRPDSKQKRAELAAAHGLPCDMSANAMLEAFNLLGITLPTDE